MSVPLASISRPASVAPPQSVPPGIANSGPLSVQGPGSVQPFGGPSSVQSHCGPGSVQSHGGPGSVQPHCGPGSIQSQGGLGSVQQHGGPGSVQSHGGPGSVQQHGSHGLLQNQGGPGSVQPHGGPGSVQSQSGLGSIQQQGGPGSVQSHGGPPSVNVQPPGSLQNMGAPGSVKSLAAPGSVQNPGSMGPQSVQPPGSNAFNAGAPNSAAPQTPYQNKPSEPRPSEEQLRTVQDPVSLTRTLISSDLRQSILEVNRQCGALLNARRNQETNGNIDAPLTEEVANYQRALWDFSAVVDTCDVTITTMIESLKHATKFEQCIRDKNQRFENNTQLLNAVKTFVDSTAGLQSIFDESIGKVTNRITSMRKRQRKFRERSDVENTSHDEPSEKIADDTSMEVDFTP
ncbi:unnamed protein product [Caenorhabditis bovis]|uniref:Mediator of RNA polymerase II transcription subunit 29 n=1 Tax=Caenorhabditis bovis TaxID=2654633 RepID=A0A8S1EL60_9PELO|nr:unnamed protein product [Caenorhabditis bovis]